MPLNPQFCGKEMLFGFMRNAQNIKSSMLVGLLTDFSQNLHSYNGPTSTLRRWSQFAQPCIICIMVSSLFVKYTHVKIKPRICCTVYFVSGLDSVVICFKKVRIFVITLIEY